MGPQWQTPVTSQLTFLWSSLMCDLSAFLLAGSGSYTRTIIERGNIGSEKQIQECCVSRNTEGVHPLIY